MPSTRALSWSIRRAGSAGRATLEIVHLQVVPPFRNFSGTRAGIPNHKLVRLRRAALHRAKIVMGLGATTCGAILSLAAAGAVADIAPEVCRVASGSERHLDIRQGRPCQHADTAPRSHRANNSHGYSYRPEPHHCFTKRRQIRCSRYFTPSPMLAAIQQPLATLGEEPSVVVAAIIGISPFERLPLPLAIGERHFGKDAVSQIDSMRMILRRGQYELGRRDVTGVEIQRPRLGVPPERGVFGFPIVGLAFDAGQFGRVDKLSRTRRTAS